MAKTPYQRVKDTRRRHKERGGVRVDLVLPPGLAEKLDGRAKLENAPRAEIVRSILDEALRDQT